MLQHPRVRLLSRDCIAAAPGLAQTPAPARGRLLVTVTDPERWVIPNARVTVTGQDDATRSPSAPSDGVNDGVAAFENLPPAGTRFRPSSPVSRPSGARRPRPRRRQPRRFTADQESRRGRDGRPRRADSGARSARQRVLDRADARADRRAARRSRRDGSGAQGDGAAGRDHPRRRLHRRPAAAEVADPIDPPAAHGHVRRPEPRRHAGA